MSKRLVVKSGLKTSKGIKTEMIRGTRERVSNLNVDSMSHRNAENRKKNTMETRGKEAPEKIFEMQANTSPDVKNVR